MGWISIKLLLGFIIGAVLWRLGGYRWKWVRRYVLALVITLNVWAKDRKLKKLLIFPLLVGAFSLGYGEKHPYWQKFLTGIAWILPALIFFRNWYALFIPFVWIGLFKLSNTKPYANIFKWNVVEIITGGMIGVTYAGI